MLVVQRRAAERVEKDVGGRLGDGQLARRRPSGEGCGDRARSIGDKGPQVRHARAALARSCPTQAGSLDQFEVLEALRPHVIQIVDGDL